MTPQMLGTRRMPPFPGWWRALGPGIVWLALAQGSGELIWWPYTVAKYGLGFLFLLIPACLLQFPVNYQIGYYTLLTGEGIFRGFERLSRPLAVFLWLLMTLSLLWFGAFAAAGGTSLAALTNFPSGCSVRAQTLFWGYLSIAVFWVALVRSRFVYRLIERFMWGVAVVTFVGLIAACSAPEVRGQAAAFFKGLAVPQWPAGRAWDPADATKLLTAITFAGLGGFWTLFYSYWLREKGAGMAGEGGVLPENSKESVAAWGRWKRFLAADSLVGIVGNLVTTLMSCLLAFALLFPKGLLPEKFQIAVVQSEFFASSWGAWGRVLFLGVAAAFLADTWLATAGTVAGIHADVLPRFFPALAAWPRERLYRWLIHGVTLVTVATMALDEPGSLILLSAVIGFCGTVVFTVALYRLNNGLLRAELARPFHQGRVARLLMIIAIVAYLALAAAYLWAQIGSRVVR